MSSREKKSFHPLFRRPVYLLSKRQQHGCFSVNFAKVLKTVFDGTLLGDYIRLSSNIGQVCIGKSFDEKL